MTLPSSRFGVSLQVALLAAARFFEAIGAGMIVPILPLFLAELEPGPFAGLSDAAKTGLVFFSFGSVTTAGQYVFGRLSDRFGHYKTGILVAIAAFSLLAAALPSVDSYTGLLLVRVGQGLALGLSIPCLWTILTHHSPADTRGASVGFYTSVRMVGFALGPLLGGHVADSLGFDAAFLGCAAFGAVTFGLVYLLVEDVGPAAPIAPPPATGETRPGGPFVLLGLAVFACLFPLTMVISYFPDYEVRFGAGATDLSWVFSLTIVSRLVLQYPIGAASDRIGRKPFLIAGLLAIVPLTVLMAFARSIGDLMVLRALLGAAMAAVVAPAYALAGDRSDPRRRGRQLGLVSMGFTAGVMAGPLVSGFVSQSSPSLPWYLGAAVPLAVAFLIQLRVADSRGRWARPG